MDEIGEAVRLEQRQEARRWGLEFLNFPEAVFVGEETEIELEITVPEDLSGLDADFCTDPMGRGGLDLELILENPGRTFAAPIAKEPLGCGPPGLSRTVSILWTPAAAGTGQQLLARVIGGGSGRGFATSTSPFVAVREVTEFVRRDRALRELEEQLGRGARRVEAGAGTGVGEPRQR